MTSATCLATGAMPLFDFAAAEDLGAMDIPGCQIGPGTFAEVLMLDACGAVGGRRQRRLFPPAGLHTRLFVCGDAVITGIQWSALPDAFVKIEDGSRRLFPQCQVLISTGKHFRS
jgi:hypothetical protein